MAHDEDMYAGYEPQEYASEQWWLATPASGLLVWARLRVLESGVAHVFDSQGETLVYESEEFARGALMEADFRAIDGMDDDDAMAAAGMLVEELQPPDGQSDDELLPQMIRNLGPRH